MAKRIVVTGGNGFLGSHIVDRLWEVGGSHVSVPTMARYDLRDPWAVRRMYSDFEPEIVINCAAHVGGIKANLASPATFFYNNLAVGMHILEEGRDRGVEKFIQIGSACEYPRDAALPLKEEDIWNGYPEPSNAAYAIAKRSLLAMGQAYSKEYGMNVIHLVPTNLYGPRDNFNPETSHVIPALIGKFLSGSLSVEILGDGKATRDFLFVEDAAKMIVDALALYDSPAPLNLGSGSCVTIAGLVHTITNLTNYNGECVFTGSKMNGQPGRILDTANADSLGIKSTTDLENGLKETITWYLKEKSRSGI